MIIEGKKLISYSLFFSFLMTLVCAATITAKAQGGGIPEDCGLVLLQRNITLLTLTRLYPN